MSTSLERRSPSLESMSSAFSFDDNPGIPPMSPNVSVQSASQGVVSNFWTQAEQEDWLSESERMGKKASLGNEHSTLFEASKAAVDAYPMHERFCFPAENIYFLVEDVLYSVHRYFFDRDSSSFVGQGLSKQEPMVLANVSTHDFDLFLLILYPTSFGVHSASTVEEWSGILYIADKWSFLSIRRLAIAQIAPIASAIDRIVFGRLYGINEWLASAYHAVCTRLDALTLEDGRRLGVDDAIRINAIRQEFCFIRVSDTSPKLFEEDIKLRFGLAIQTECSSSRKSIKDAADMWKPDSAAESTSKKEEAARAADIQRKKKRQQDAADKKTKDLEEMKTQGQREAEAKLKKVEEAKAAEIEQKKRAADKKAKELEEKNIQEQCEIEGKAAEIEQKKRAQEAADKKAEDLEDKRATKAKPAEDQREESPTMGKQCPEAPTVGKIKIKRNKNRNKKAISLALGDTTDVESEALTPVDEKSNETMLARALEGAREAWQGKVLREKEQNGTPNTSIGTAANEEEDWSHLTPFHRYCKKDAKIRKERDAEERAELVKQMKQQLADKAKAVEGGATRQGAGGTSSVSIPEPHGVSGVSYTAIVAAANGTEHWSHLTPETRMWRKLAKAQKEQADEEHAERAAKLLKEVKQQMADEAKATEEAAAQRGAGSCNACNGGPDSHVCG